MASGPKVSVLLELVDRLTQPVEGARGQLTKFGSQVSTAFKALAAGIAALGLAKFFKDAIGEAAAAQLSMNRFDVALRNVGRTYQDVAPEAEALFKQIQKTTRFADDDAREAMTKLVVVTGDYGKALNLMQVTADLAAYKQIGLVEAAELVGRASTGNLRVMKELGITTTDAGEAVAELATKVKGFAAQDAKTFTGALEQIKNKWADVLEAIGNAIVGNDQVSESMGGVVGVLADLEGWITANEGAISGLVTGTATLIGALKDVAYVLAYPLYGAWVTVMIPINGFISVVQMIPEAFKWAFGRALGALGEFGVAAKKVLGLVGIQMDEGVAEKWKATGERMARDASGNMRIINSAFETTVAGFFRASEDLETTVGRVGLATRQASTGTGTALTEVATRTRAAVLDLDAVFGQVVPKVIDTVERELTPAVLTQIDAQESFRQKLGEIRTAFGAYQVAADQATDEERTEKTKRFAGEVTSLMRGLVGAGQAMGGFSDATAAALQNAINLGDAISKIATGDVMGGITQGIGSLAGLLKGFFGESESSRRIRLAIEGNTRKLEEHRRVLGDLVTLQSSGAKLSGVQGALGGVAGFLGGLTGVKGSQQLDTVDKAIRGVLGKALRESGLGFGDLEAVAKDLGVSINDSEGRLNAKMLLQLLDALGAIEPTQFRDSFAGQRERLRSETDLFNLSETEQARRLLALAGGSLGSGLFGERLGGFDLSSAEGRAGAIAAIQQLFTDLPGLGAGDLGGLSGQEFLDVLTELKNLLSGEPPAADAGGAAGGVGGFAVPSGAAAEAAGFSLADLIPLGREGLGHLAAIAENTSVLPTWAASPGPGASGRGAGFSLTIGEMTVMVAPGTDARQTGVEVAQALAEELGRQFRDVQLAQGSAAR